MADFESRYVIHPSKEMAGKWAVRGEQRYRSAKTGQFVTKSHGSSISGSSGKRKRRKNK